MTSATTRRLDRAEEKLIRREREVEGDEFADEVKFVRPGRHAHIRTKWLECDELRRKRRNERV